MFNSCVTEETWFSSFTEYGEEGLDKKNICDVDTTRFDEQLEIIFLVLKITNNEYL